MLAKPLLFLSSYAPLFLMLIVRFWGNWWLFGACASLGAAGIAGAFWILAVRRKAEPEIHAVKSVRTAGPEASTYLATYILPFLTTGTPSGQDITIFIMFFATLGVIHVRSSAIQVNPTLYLMGKQILLVTDEFDEQFFVVADRDIHRGDDVSVVELSRDVRVQRTRPEVRFA